MSFYSFIDELAKADIAVYAFVARLGCRAAQGL
jgi:hypothetical protein